MMTGYALLVGVLAVALLATPPPSASAKEVPVRVGEPFPALLLPSLADGSPLSIGQFRGRKVLLHQFASW
jgi:hypothetical protein